MKHIYTFFTIYFTFFLTAFCYGMEQADTILPADIVTQYKALCDDIWDDGSWSKDNKGHFTLKDRSLKLITLQHLLSCSDNPKYLLDTVLDNGKRLIHRIVWLSTIHSTQKHVLPKTIIPFWNILFEYKAELNSKDDNGNTPLMDAFLDQAFYDTLGGKLRIKKSSQCNFEVVQILLYHGANPFTCNSNEECAAALIDQLTMEDHYTTRDNRIYYDEVGTCRQKMQIEYIKEKCSKYRPT